MLQPPNPCRRASGFVLGGALLLALVLACGDDAPTGVGRELRTHPDSLHALELPDAWEDSVFSLPVSLRSSPTGQVGSQRPYTAQILYDFRVPTFAVDEGETLRLDVSRFEIPIPRQSNPPFSGGMRLALREVALDERGWSEPAVYDSMVLTRLPELRPGFVADEKILEGDSLVVGTPGIELSVDVRRLADYDSVLAELDTLEVNVALVFQGFATGGPGFVEFTQIGSTGPVPRFIGNYRDPMSGLTGIDVPVAPRRQLVVVEFDSTFTTGTDWVVSDAHRFHTFFEFPDLRTLPDSVLPREAVVHRADLILVQADSSEAMFGAGLQTLGCIVPSDAVLADSTQVFSVEENNRGIAFQNSVSVNPGGQFVVAVTTYYFDQQEGSVRNRGMILRLANEGTKARQFLFYGSRDPDPGVRPRLRLLYAVPSDFGGE